MKKKMTVLAGLVLVAVLSLGSVAGTYAKYTSSTDGSSDSARVAKWGFDFSDSVNSDIELFANYYNSGKIASAEKVIAPGASGNYSVLTIDSTNKPEVDYNVKFEINIVDKDGDVTPLSTALAQRLLFSYDGVEYDTFANFKNELETYISGNYDAGDTFDIEGSNTLKIYWKWPFDEADADGLANQDEGDTILGNADASDLEKVKIAFSLSATQIK